MIGILDSGAGGELAARELRGLLPSVDIVLLADRKNAPYGTKSPEELTEIVRENLSRLRYAGADEILIACGTASTVLDRLKADERRGVYPIIEPTARAAAEATASGRVGVIATEATVRSRAFTRAIRSARGGATTVFELATQELVSMIEAGARDGCISRSDVSRLRQMLSPVWGWDVDVLVLGCTHFPLLFNTVGELFPGVRLISSTHEGVKKITRLAKSGSGATVYL